MNEKKEIKKETNFNCKTAKIFKIISFSLYACALLVLLTAIIIELTIGLSNCLAKILICVGCGVFIISSIMDLYINRSTKHKYANSIITIIFAIVIIILSFFIKFN